MADIVDNKDIDLLINKIRHKHRTYYRPYGIYTIDEDLTKFFSDLKTNNLSMTSKQISDLIKYANNNFYYDDKGTTIPIMLNNIVLQPNFSKKHINYIFKNNMQKYTGSWINKLKDAKLTVEQNILLVLSGEREFLNNITVIDQTEFCKHISMYDNLGVDTFINLCNKVAKPFLEETVSKFFDNTSCSIFYEAFVELLLKDKYVFTENNLKYLINCCYSSIYIGLQTTERIFNVIKTIIPHIDTITLSLYQPIINAIVELKYRKLFDKLENLIFEIIDMLNQKKPIVADDFVGLTYNNNTQLNVFDMLITRYNIPINSVICCHSCLPTNYTLFEHLKKNNILILSPQLLEVSCKNNNDKVINELINLKVLPNEETAKYINNANTFTYLVGFGLPITYKTIEYQIVNSIPIIDNITDYGLNDHDKLWFIFHKYRIEPVKVLSNYQFNPILYQFRTAFLNTDIQIIKKMMAEYKLLPDQFCYDYAFNCADTKITDWLEKDYNLQPTFITVARLNNHKHIMRRLCDIYHMPIYKDCEEKYNNNNYEAIITYQKEQEIALKEKEKEKEEEEEEKEQIKEEKEQIKEEKEQIKEEKEQIKEENEEKEQIKEENEEKPNSKHTKQTKKNKKAKEKPKKEHIKKIKAKKTDELDIENQSDDDFDM